MTSSVARQVFHSQLGYRATNSKSAPICNQAPCYYKKKLFKVISNSLCWVDNFLVEKKDIELNKYHQSQKSMNQYSLCKQTNLKCNSIISPRMLDHTSACAVDFWSTFLVSNTEIHILLMLMNLYQWSWRNIYFITYDNRSASLSQFWCPVCNNMQ